MKYLTTAYRFLVKSSADPRATSLTVKGILALGVTFYTAELLPNIQVFCEFGYGCMFSDPRLPMLLNEGVALITDLVYLILMTVSSVIAVVGFVRKVRRTVEGNNLAIKE